MILIKKLLVKKLFIAIPTNQLKKPTPLEINNDNGFKEAYGKKKRKDAIKKKEDDLQNKGILSAAKISEERFLKSWKKLMLRTQKLTKI